MIEHSFNGHTAFLMDPVNQYPGLFHHDGQIKTFLVTYPFFLPCFSIVLYSLFAGFITFFFVEETMEDTKKHQHNEEPATFIEETRVKRYSTFESPHKHTMQRQLPRQNMIQFDCSIFQRMRLALTPPVAHAISMSFLAVCAYLAFEGRLTEQSMQSKVLIQNIYCLGSTIYCLCYMRDTFGWSRI